MASRIVLIDGNSLIHRAYHALPPLTTASGQPTNAAFGFVQMVLLLLQSEQPDVAVLALDTPGPTFRDNLYGEYKAHRPPMEEALVSQLGIIRELAEAMGLRCVELPGYEADDIIGTLAREGSEAGRDVLVVSGDRDVLQLVNDHTRVMATLRGIRDTKTYDPAAVREEYGLPPAAIADLKGLAGDTSDNIPGVPKVGPKTATDLLIRFGTVEELYAQLEAVDKPTLRERLREHEALARLSKELATIDTRAPLPADLLAETWPGLDVELLRRMLGSLEFTSLLDRLPAAISQPPRAEVAVTPEAIAALCRRAIEAGHVGVAVVVEGDQAAGVALAVGTGQMAYCEVASAPEAVGLFACTEPTAPSCVVELLASTTVQKVGHDLKGAARALAGRELALDGFGFDTAVAQYLIAPHRGDPGVAALAAQYLGESLAAAPGESEQPLSAAAAQAAATAEAVLRLQDPLTEQLAALEQRRLFEQVEMPLTHVLRDMERVGIGVDCGKLDEIGDKLAGLMLEHSERVFKLAGERFNLDSPKQLAQVLFEKLALPRGRRTKTGWSTDADVLEELAVEHDVVARVLEYRESAKLKSTYVDGLSRLVGPDGRVRTTFEQTVAATGRLSSRNPNLQNIPIRTEWGREIRSCFVAQGPGRVLLSADYSQIELRIMAHLSREESLLESFRAGEDIHRRTAAAIFGLSPEAVGSDQRRVAKTVNYAVTYGMGATALARQLGVPRAQAQQFIESYFRSLPRVKQYLEDVVTTARDQGWVGTLLGRRRPVPDVRSGNPGARAYAERAAANTPLQGSAADIIKVAMVELARRLPGVSPASRLLLQVHDELVLELHETDVAVVAGLVREVMQDAVVLDVPLVVEPKVGVNWRDMQAV
jgi:DNA polymerase-1